MTLNTENENQYDIWNEAIRVRDAKTDYFTGTTSASEVYTLTCVPLLPYLKVSFYTTVNSVYRWVEQTIDTNYAIAGTGAYENRYLTLWQIMPTTPQYNIKVEYNVKVSNIVATVSDIEIGQVEIKNYDTPDEVYVAPDHTVKTHQSPALGTFEYGRNASNYITTMTKTYTDGSIYYATVTRNGSNYINTTVWTVS